MRFTSSGSTWLVVLVILSSLSSGCRSGGSDPAREGRDAGLSSDSDADGGGRVEPEQPGRNGEDAAADMRDAGDGPDGDQDASTKPIKNANDPKHRPHKPRVMDASVDEPDAMVEDAAEPDDAALLDAGDTTDTLKIIDAQPVNASTGVSPNARITVAWSADLSVASIASVTLRDHLGAAVSGSMLVPGDDRGGFYDEATSTYYPALVPDDTFVLIPSALAVGEHYTLDFGTLEGANGEVLASSAKLAFTVLDPVQIVAGGIHNLLLERDGSVWGWGGSIYGAAGSGGTTTTVWAPTRVVGFDGPGTFLSAAKQVAAAEYTSLALLSNGSVCAWGVGDQGQLGNGLTYAANTGSGTPVHVSNLANITAVAAGATFGLALKDDGTVWAWGANDQGQLGRGTTTSSSTPVQVLTSSGALGNVTAIAAGASHALALKADGSVVAWGDSAAGQVGTTAADLLFATPVAGLSNITALSARYNHSLALASNGKVYQWGAQESKVGAGGITWNNVATPTAISFPAGVTVAAIRAGYHHFLAADAGGTLYSWGLDYYGELFGTTGVDRPTPQVAVSTVSNLVDFSAGGAFPGTHSVYVSGAQVIGRGSSKYGQSTGN